MSLQEDHLQQHRNQEEAVEERYSRQILFAPIGRAGQERLAQSRVLIVGMGALGTVLANHLVRAGTGFVRITDRDYVEFSNLQRQMLFDEEDAREALPKAEAAARKLVRINSSVTIEPVITDVTARNIEELAADVDLILDGTDNFQTRYLMNDYAFRAKIPYVYGGVVSSRGMSAAFIPGRTPCFRLFAAGGRKRRRRNLRYRGRAVPRRRYRCFLSVGRGAEDLNGQSGCRAQESLHLRCLAQSLL